MCMGEPAIGSYGSASLDLQGNINSTREVIVQHVLSAVFILFALSLAPASEAALQFGGFEGDSRPLAPSAAVLQNSEVKKNDYSNHTYGTVALGVKDVRKASRYKTVTYRIDAFNSASKSALDSCKHGDMNRCALEYEMLYRVGYFFDPEKNKLQGTTSLIQTNISKSEFALFRKPAPASAFGSYHVLEYTFKHNDGVCEYHYMLHAGNVAIDMSSVSDKTCIDPEVQQASLAMAGEILAKLPRSGPVAAVAAAEEPKKQEPRQDEPELTVAAYPAPGLSAGSTVVMPASRMLPARIDVKTRPGTSVAFEIQNGDKAELSAGTGKGPRVYVNADKSGAASAQFFYIGESIKSPLRYEVKVSAAGRSETVTIHVGLGLAFDRITAVKGDIKDTHAFTLGVKSIFQPQLNISNYLHGAQQSGVWNGNRVGLKMKMSWLNPPAGATPDLAFAGTADIITAKIGNNVLRVAKGEPQYYMTHNAYPAVVMKSSGKHAYKVNAGMVVLDASGESLGFVEEGMQQNGALLIVSSETPEHWLTSLVCSLEVQDEVQYALMETAKMLPGGDVVEALTSVTGLMCKFGQAEYESLFYDIGTIIGGKYLEHLTNPEVFEKLTPRQQTAAANAKKAYDKLDEHKQKKEREKWVAAAAERAAPKNKPTEPSLKQDLQKGVNEVKKSINDLGSTLKDVFK